ncbi:MAG: aldo/keto reductase [Methyloceanibacter sp.]|nr:aldo/keto reductase [Methyloceanibacter sp.]
MEHASIHGLPFPASRIALGTWAIGGWKWGGTDESDAIATIHHALDVGINTVDTAPAYGFGHSEEIVGKALEGRRDRVLIATKAGMVWDSVNDTKLRRESSVPSLRRQLEDSLRRLRTDIIDLYQIHWPDESVDFEETGAVLETFRREGKVRAIGLSNCTVQQIESFAKGATLASLQPPYNLFERAAEKDILPYAKAHDLVVLCYGSLCRGLLTGKITPETTFKGDDLRNNDPKFQPDRRGQYLAAVARLQTLAKEKFGKSLLAFAERWVLDRGNTIALWGARRPEQLAPVADVMGWHIDEATMHEIDDILTETITDPVGPEFMAPPRTQAA